MIPRTELRERFASGRRAARSDKPCMAFALAMPVFIAPNCRGYQIEDALDRSVVGLAVGAKLDASGGGCAAAGAFEILAAAGRHEFGVRGTGREGNEILVREPGGAEVCWRRRVGGLAFVAGCPDRPSGSLVVDTAAHSATWTPGDAGAAHAGFRTVVHRSLASTVRSLLHLRGPAGFSNDDVLFDDRVRYGVPGWAIGGVLLAIRMMLVPVDFE